MCMYFSYVLYKYAYISMIVLFDCLRHVVVLYMFTLVVLLVYRIYSYIVYISRIIISTVT